MISPQIEDTILEEIYKDPEAFIRDQKLDKVAALKLQIPEIIRVQRRQRRYHWDNFEQAVREVNKRDKEIAYAVKHERDTLNKLRYGNSEAREKEIEDRKEADGIFIKWNAMRASMYASCKKIDEDIDFYERIDQSLLEILAMFTARLSFEQQTGYKYGTTSNSRSSSRAAKRAAAATGTKPESLPPS